MLALLGTLNSVYHNTCLCVMPHYYINDCVHCHRLHACALFKQHDRQYTAAMSTAHQHQQQALQKLQCKIISAWHQHSHIKAHLRSAAIAFAAKRSRRSAVKALHKLQLLTRHRKGNYLNILCIEVVVLHVIYQVAVAVQCGRVVGEMRAQCHNVVYARTDYHSQSGQQQHKQQQ
jgi:hypothetical protein